MVGKKIIGLTGPFGSGCSYIAEKILSLKGYKYISLSEILRDNIVDKDCSRSDLQDKGNEIRAKSGAGFLADEAIKKIDSLDEGKFVIDSIRNTHEIESFKKHFPEFYLLAVWASKDTRWERVKGKYNGDLSTFEKDDKRDKDEKDENGQQITLCYQMADAIILNETKIHAEQTDDFIKLKTIVERYVDLIEKNAMYEPTEMETLMAMAYANSMRSSCTQRKVGALIIDEYGNVFSSGYNEVPILERSCKREFGMCYRKFLRQNIDEKIQSELNDSEVSNKISTIVKNNSKMLDYCRALHAEENAIINMARLSVSANRAKATLYTTTYPCNLCANKIAQIGIKKVIYYEPYPQEEAKKTLAAHNVNQVPFEGVTFNSYFKFMEVLR